MKKSLLALAVLGAFAGAASAQSSVTLFGILDANAHFVKNDGQSRKLSLDDSGINSSRLGFRGVEDLGGGLKAAFWLEAGLNIGTGVEGSTAAASKVFNRRSTVSLLSGAGELRLGRDYVPSFWNETIFDAFGTNGLGGSNNVFRYFHVREDNSIGYFLPSNIGGFYGQAMVAAGESNGGSTAATSLDKPGRYVGGRIGFAAGPFDVAFSAAQQTFTTAAAPGILLGDKVKTYNLGGSYDFSFLKLLGYVERDSFSHGKEMKYSLSTVIPFGQSEVHVGYNRSKYSPDSTCPAVFNATTCSSIVQQYAATYQYNLSKRTAMYGTGSILDNKNPTTQALAGRLRHADGGRQVEGLRGRRSSRVLITRSPLEFYANEKAAFGRPFS